MNLLLALNILAWIGAIINLAAAWYATHHESNQRRLGYILFLIDDLCLVGIQIYNHTWSQVFLFAAFAVLNVRGIHNTLKHPQVEKEEVLD